VGCRFSRFPGPSLLNHLHNIFIADDDDGHAFLVEDCLRRGGLNANFLRFVDGQEVLDFLLRQTSEPVFKPEETNLLLLDIRMPKVDGIAVLARIKAESALRALPVIMLTTTVDPFGSIAATIWVATPIFINRFPMIVLPAPWRSSPSS